MPTMRETARNTLIEQVDTNLLTKIHEPHYWRLYVNPDGSLFWHEHAVRSKFIQDPDFPEEATPWGSVVTVGTGDRPCTCDDCEAEHEMLGKEIMVDIRTKNIDQIKSIVFK